MEVLYARCCGLDVHRSFVVACLSIIEAGYRRKETRTFGTTTRELLLLRRWLIEAGCTHIGMESTGVLWRPVADRLTSFFELVLVNAQHMKRVPGRFKDNITTHDAIRLTDTISRAAHRSGHRQSPQKLRFQITPSHQSDCLSGWLVGM